MKNHTIRYIPGDTYSRTAVVNRTTNIGTEPYDFTGYQITFTTTVDTDFDADVSFLDEEDGEISIFLPSALTAELGEIEEQVEYEIVVSLNTDEVILTLLRGRLVDDES